MPVQLSKTVRGTKKDAQRLAAQLTLRPSPTAGRRTVAELLDDYVKTQDTNVGDPDAR
jgi:hypothetical protein